MKTETEQKATPRPCEPSVTDRLNGIVATLQSAQGRRSEEACDLAVWDAKRVLELHDRDQEIIRELVEALEESMVIVCGDIAAHRGNEKANYRAFDLARLAIAKVKARHV